MSPVLKVIIFIIGISLCLLVLRLLVRKRINEKNSLIWLFGMIAIFLLSINPEMLDVVAAWAGVDYPPSLLFLASVLVLLIVVLYQSIQISQLYVKIKEISQYVALLHEERGLGQPPATETTREDGAERQ